MSWSVIGLGNIEVDEKYVKKILSLMIGDKKEVLDKLGQAGSDFYEVQAIGGSITFRMDGNKGIYYDGLDRIKEYCKIMKIEIEISVNEYSECDGGYYFNSGDDEE